MKDKIEIGKTGEKIVSTLKSLKGEKISVRELAKRMDNLQNYTWILEKSKRLFKDKVIEMADEIYDTGYRNIKTMSKVVWIK